MSNFLEFATQLAVVGGDVIRSFGTNFQVEKKGAVNLVTEADYASEKEITSRIKNTFPEHSILAEEGSESFSMLSSGYCWVVDPLDGTTNFAANIPQVGVSVALCKDGVPIAGAVLDVFRGELFSAAKGQGAFLNGNRLSVTSGEALIDEVICTGFPYDRTENWDRYNRYFSNVCLACRDLRRFGAASVDLAWVAAGRLGGFFECGLQPWDLAAGVLLIEEAGGRVGTFGNSDAENVLLADTIVTAGPGVFQELVTCLQK